MAGTDQAVMDRLINARGLEHTDERLAELFRASSTFESDPFRKRRVYVRLMRAPARAKRSLGSQAVLVATLLVSGTAVAALGQRYATRNGMIGFGAPTPAPSAALPVRVSPHSNSPNHDDPSAAVSDDTEASDDAASANPPPSASRLAPSAHAQRGSTDDVTHVFEAIQALRMDADPARAQSLLDEYLKGHPHGVLSADALALSIEAASTLHDPRAADYARRYLAQFPQGKYRDLATRALAKQ